MNPLAATVTGTAKPALISAQDFLVQGCGIYHLVQTEELRSSSNGICIRVRSVSYGRPGSGNLIRLLEYAPAGPGNDEIAAVWNRSGDNSWGSPQRNKSKEKQSSARQNCFRRYELRLRLSIKAEN